MSNALLVILDGYGIAEDPETSAIDQADTPYFDSLIENYPHARLLASGESVGLPQGQFGNSEVGHLNIGAGRIVWQELSRINNSIKSGEFYKNPALVNAFTAARERGRIHFMGLFSDGGVHSHNDHLYALMEMASQQNLEQVYVHAFTDGRDTSPNGGAHYLKEFREKAKEIGVGEIASIVGRYYAMDRDNRWERIEKAYNLLTRGEGTIAANAEQVFKESYAAGTTDEFLEPHLIQTTQDSRIREGDVVIFYNIRGDRAREITKALFNHEEVPFETRDLKLNYTTFTSYDDLFDSFLHVAFPPQRMDNTLGEYLGKKNVRQLRVAETEKYPHVTYFFNGGVETPIPGEDRIVIPSPKVPTYDLKPEMSAAQVGDVVVENLMKEEYQFVVVNFANPDMVGHTGNMQATIKAVEAVDEQLKRVVEAAKQHNYDVLIIADHGNADCMVNSLGRPHTAHTSAPVPVILVSDNPRTPLKNGKLADVAPTILQFLGLEKPEEMTGTSLI